MSVCACACVRGAFRCIWNQVSVLQSKIRRTKEAVQPRAKETTNTAIMHPGTAKHSLRLNTHIVAAVSDNKI